MLEDDDRENIYRDYTATMQKHVVDLLGRYFYGEQWTMMPSYIEMAHPAEAPTKSQEESDRETIENVYKSFGIIRPEGGDT